MEASQKQIVDFLERNLIGRTVTSQPVITRTAQGGIESTYIDQNFYSNLVQTPDGFSFDITFLAMGRRFGLNAQGKREDLAGTLDAIRVYRYEMTERPSTGRVLGFARFISSTNTESDPVAGTCFMVRMSLEGEDLIVYDTQIGYSDFIGHGGALKPVASDGIYRYTQRDGRLLVRFQQSTFAVDPDTLERTPTSDVFPAQISEEVVPAFAPTA